MGEALALLRNDIDLEEGIIKVTKATEFYKSKPKTKTTKTYRGIRDIPIPEELLNYLKQYQKTAKNSLYLFPGHAGDPMGLSELNRIWRSANKRIKNWFKHKDNEKMIDHKFILTFRLLRHTYCTGLYDAGIDEVSAAELMGHDINIMRKVYTHLSNERKKKTIAKLETLYKEPQKSNVVDLKKESN